MAECLGFFSILLRSAAPSGLDVRPMADTDAALNGENLQFLFVCVAVYQLLDICHHQVGLQVKQAAQSRTHVDD
jgi:hypothetical protein